MSPLERASWLARLVRVGKLSEASAFVLQKTGIAPRLLPLSPVQGLRPRELDGKYVQAYLGRWPGEGAIRLNKSIAVRSVFREKLQTQYQKQVAGLAKSVSTGKISVAQWQQRMADAISNHSLRQAALGRGATMSKAEAIRFSNDRIRPQLAFLQRFADEIALAEATGKPLTAAQIANRASLYAGDGRAAFFQEYERLNAKPGYVARYRARDDGGTCGPCIAAQGTYLSGEGPMPGDVCRGHGRCRCVRELVLDPVAYARLTGQPETLRRAN